MVDWIQDAARERYRKRQSLREARLQRTPTSRLLYKLWDLWQPWIVIILIGTQPLLLHPKVLFFIQKASSFSTTVLIPCYSPHFFEFWTPRGWGSRNRLMEGIFIGVNAACINVITEWLSDFKLGYCTNHWYLNQQFCCWQESLETCTNWRPWSSLSLINYIFYILFAVSLPPLDYFLSPSEVVSLSPNVASLRLFGGIF